MPSQHDSQLHLADVLTEVSIMEMFRDVPGICKLLDFGVSAEGFKLVMPLYQGDLAAWRANMPDDIQSIISNETLFLSIFSQARLRKTFSMCKFGLVVHIWRIFRASTFNHQKACLCGSIFTAYTLP